MPMYLKQTKQKNGRVNLSIVHGYRDPVTGKTKHKIIQNLGYVDEYLDRFDDPVAHFKKVAQDMEAERLATLDNFVPIGDIDLNETLDPGENALYHIGFLPVSFIFHELGLDRFLMSRQRRFKIDFALKDVLQLLIYKSILSPETELQNSLARPKFPMTLNCERQDIGRGLACLLELKEDLLLHTHCQVKERYGRRADPVFCVSTDNFFGIDPKNNFDGITNYKNRTVQLSLLLDENAIPITYCLSKGDTRSRQIPDELREDYALGRMINIDDKNPKLRADAFRNLREIEHHFEIASSTHKAWPIDLSLKQRIDAHFLISFLSLLFLRLLGQRLNNKYSFREIVDALKNYRACLFAANVYRVTSYNAIIEDIGKALDLDLRKRYLSQEKMRQLIAQTKKF